VQKVDGPDSPVAQADCAHFFRDIEELPFASPDFSAELSPSQFTDAHSQPGNERLVFVKSNLPQSVPSADKDTSRIINLLAFFAFKTAT